MDPVTPSSSAQWDTCCSKSSAQFVKFITQAVLAAGMMVFCMVQLNKETNSNKELYWGALCSILFTFMPHPQLGGGIGKRDLRDELERQAATPRPPPRSLPEPQPLQDDTQGH